MRSKLCLAAMCLSLVLCTQAFAGDSGTPCHKGPLRGWLKAVLTVQCKTCIFCKNPPAPAAPDAAPADAPKDTPKPDASPAPPTPAAPATPAPPAAKPG